MENRFLKVLLQTYQIIGWVVFFSSFLNQKLQLPSLPWTYFYSFIYDESEVSWSKAFFLKGPFITYPKWYQEACRYYAQCFQHSVRGMIISDVWAVLDSWTKFIWWKGRNREGLLTTHSYIPCAQLIDCFEGRGVGEKA